MKGPEELTVWGLQRDCVWEDPAANIADVDIWLQRQAASTPPHPDLIVLPEMWNSGFSMHPERFAEPWEKEAPSLLAMARWAREFGAAVVGSCAFKSPHGFHNRLVFMPPATEGEPTFYDKYHRFSPAQEHLRFDGPRSPEAARVVVAWRGWRLRLIVCYDLRFPVFCRWTPDFPYDALVCVACWPSARIHAWRTLLQARAIENQCAVIGINRVGTDAMGHVHCGQSALVDAWGTPLAQLPFNQNGWLMASFDGAAQSRFREQLPFLDDADSFRFIS